jgi:hypothetical protein
MPKLLATVGGLIICAGVDLLWQSRLQVQYWVETYLKYLSAMWRRQFSNQQSANRQSPNQLVAATGLLPRPGSMQVLLGLGFVLLLGPALLLVSLTLVFYPQ